MKRDEQLANMQDYDGNTALHLACNKAHKQTVNTLLVGGEGGREGGRPRVVIAGDKHVVSY